MTISDIYKTLNKNIGITIYINDNYARYCKTKFNIPITDMENEITHIGMDEDGLVIYVCVPYVEYEDLDVHAKLNAVDAYINNICAYDDFTEAHDLQELENWCIAFLENVRLYIG